MRKQFLARGVAWNALGLSLGFLAVLQTPFLIAFGLRTELHWTSREDGVIGKAEG